MFEAVADQQTIISGKSLLIDKLIYEVTDSELKETLLQNLEESIAFLTNKCDERQVAFDDTLSEALDLWQHTLQEENGNFEEFADGLEAECDALVEEQITELEVHQ